MVDKMTFRKKSVCGVGINDADYPVNPIVNGKQVMCPVYMAWKAMLIRCYCKKRQIKQPTYAGCHVANEWHTFSNFSRWMTSQDWKGLCIDKDLLFFGNKVYSSKTCVLVNSMTNNFIIDSGSARGDYPIGVHFDVRDNKFRAQCNNPFTRKRELLGRFDCPNKAHQAWKNRKHQLALQLADLQTDPRVAQALRTRYL